MDHQLPDRFHTEQWRGRRFGVADRLVPVLPIVLYECGTPSELLARVARARRRANGGDDSGAG